MKYVQQYLTLLSPSNSETISYSVILYHSVISRQVIANDLAPEAVEAIRRNVKYNGVGEEGDDKGSTGKSKARVLVNKGDAWWVYEMDLGEQKEKTDMILLM